MTFNEMFHLFCMYKLGFSDDQWVKNPPAMQEIHETQVWSLGWKNPLVEENGNPLQYSCLGNLMDRGASRATVHGVTENQTDWATKRHDWATKHSHMCKSMCFMFK